MTLLSKTVLLLGGGGSEFEGFRRALEGGGFSLLRACDEGEAARLLSSSGADVAVLENGKGSPEGFRLLRHLRLRHPELPVVFVSARPSVEEAVESMREGAFDYITPEAGAERISALLAQACGRNGSPRRGAERGGSSSEIITRDPHMEELLEVTRRAAQGVAAVFIHGESGTGKELLARFIHRESPRRGGPFVAVNCAALPEGLLESELFGHEKGAFTGAIARKPGKFELAHRGTLLLDEVSEMEPRLQAKLLRVLQEQAVDRVGGREPVSVDVRVVATTNTDLRAAIRGGKFREDLFYRLNVIPLRLSPLRERKGDIPLLLDHFIRKHGARNGKAVAGASPAVAETLKGHSWPGNVRELENVVERAVLLSRGRRLEVEDLFLEELSSPRPCAPAQGSSPRAGSADELVGMTVRDVERKLIFSTLARVNDNRTRAAEMLGISIRTLRNKLKEYEVSLGGGEGARA